MTRGGVARAQMRADALQHGSLEIIAKNPLILGLIGLLVGGIAVGCIVG